MKKIIYTLIIILGFFQMGKSQTTGTGINVRGGTTFPLHVKLPEGNEGVADPVKIEGLKKGTANAEVVTVEGDGTLKRLSAVMPKFFYMPAVFVETHDASGNLLYTTSDKTLNLYQLYFDQFNMTGINGLGGNYAASSTDAKARSSSTTIPTLTADKFDYYVTYYDAAVFSKVNISTSGVLTYGIRPGAVV